MTNLPQVPKKKARATLPSLVCSLLLLTLILLLARSDLLNLWMQNGLALCAEVLIPSLFPFLILSDLILVSGAAHRLGKPLAKPISALLGISPCSVSALLLGFLCGFPIGAKMTLSLYESGQISQREAERLLPLCSVPGPAFLIGTVGGSLLGSRAYGLLLYAVNLLSSLLIGMAGTRLTKPKETPFPSQTAPAASSPLRVSRITRCVTDAAQGMLAICAFVLAFSCVIRLLELLLSYLPISLPPLIRSLLYGTLELTGGIHAAVSLGGKPALLACAIISGWSGLSVHAQTISLSGAKPVSFRPYLAAKLAAAALNGLLILPFLG